MKYLKILFSDGQSYEYAVYDYTIGPQFLHIEYSGGIEEYIHIQNIDCFKVSNTPFPVEENCEAISKETTEETTQ